MCQSASSAAKGPSVTTHGGEHGTVLATRSALNGSNRPVPCARTAAQETVVRRAVAPAHARALREDLDRRQRECPPVLRAGQTVVPHGPDPQPRRLRGGP